MDVKSVSKPAVQSTQQPPKHTEEARRAPSRESKPPEQPPVKSAQASPKPVINTQGHETGRHLNVTA